MHACRGFCRLKRNSATMSTVLLLDNTVLQRNYRGTILRTNVNGAAGLKKDYGIITARLASLRRAWRINAAIQGVLSAFLISSPLLIIGIAAGATGYARTVLIAVSLFSAFVIFVWKAAFPLLRPLSLKDAALYAESGAGSMESRISSAVSYWVWMMCLISASIARAVSSL